MTEFIFLTIFLSYLGYILGKQIKTGRLFIKLVLLAMILIGFNHFKIQENPLYLVFFSFGLALNWFNPFCVLRNSTNAMLDLFNRWKSGEGFSFDAASDLKAEQARLQKQKEELDKQKKDLDAERRAFKTRKHKQEPTEKRLDPTDVNDAHIILGVNKATSTFEDSKKAYRLLMRLYHPDKTNGLSEERKAKIENEAKSINLAWETIQKHYQK